MLRLSKLRLENFGPYKDLQEIVFPNTDGVVLVYGENMRGKTTLLNAFRYALFGRFIGRGQAQIPIHKIGNWEAAEEGNYGFKVEWSFPLAQISTFSRGHAGRGFRNPRTI